MYRLGITPKNNGEYSASAAQYLNSRDSKPSEKTALVPNPRARYSFSPFYIGKTYSSVGNIDKNRKVNYVIARDENKSEYSQFCKLEKVFGPKNPFGDEVLFL